LVIVAPVNAPPHVAEQLGFEQVSGIAAQVHLDERHVALRAAVVDGAATISLPVPRLARDEHRALGLRDELRALNTSCIARLRPTMPYWLNSALRSLIRYCRCDRRRWCFERVADEREQFFDLERLLQVVQRAELHRLDRAFDVACAVIISTCGRSDGGMVCEILANQLEPGHARHDVVDDEQVERFLDELFWAPRADGRLDDLVPLVRTRASEAF
jgi:hypothetical protein